MMTTLTASIPSPSVGTLELGPLTLRAYGLMIALSVVAAVTLSRRRWASAGGDPDEITRIAFWAVPAGLIGARAYHVLTDWRRFQGDWADVAAIWKGGLGIPGGMAAGILAGLWLAKRQRMDLSQVLVAVVPALPLAQAIGRLGNWFNQELYGAPTNLPWGLEIALEHRRPPHLDVETFHPTFLYEALWNLALCALLLAVDRRRRARGRMLQPVKPEAPMPGSSTSSADANAEPLPCVFESPDMGSSSTSPLDAAACQDRGFEAGAAGARAANADAAAPGDGRTLLAFYALGYGVGRLWIEAVRIDEASLILGVRVNIWMSATLIVASLAFLLWARRAVPSRASGKALSG